MSSRHLTRFRNWLLASPPAEWTTNQLRELLIGSLRQGPIPQHVAFVMDGNRRYARSRRIETVEGHHLGFEALARILEVCYKSGVKVVTIYAFSIENFKRSRFEVDALMEMAKVKLSQLAEHGALLDRYGASVRVLGQRDLLRPDVLEAIDRAVEMTSRNGDAVLNVCFPYTSRDEITTAVRETVAEYSEPIERSNPVGSRNPFSQTHIEHRLRSQLLPPSPALEGDESYNTPSTSPHRRSVRSPSASSVTSDSIVTDSYEPSNHESATSSTTTLNHDHDSNHDISDTLKPPPTSEPATTAAASDPPQSTYPSPELITPSILTAHTFTASNPPLDILIRTSGVERLSDFMLWQCHQDTELVFLETLWPEFDLWSFLPIMWEWQFKQRRRGNTASKHQSSLSSAPGNEANNAVAVVEAKAEAEARAASSRKAARKS